MSPLVLQTAMGPTLDATGYKQVQWPGHGVGDNQPYQYLDREYMPRKSMTIFCSTRPAIICASICRA
ncbi:MAG: hypothetical protein H6871_11320 [Methylobacteriaceae bacterium]|nr:hypothetical protein [Methylobacteriaceae bacterium]